MQEYEDLRKQKQEEYAEQRRRRIELRNSKGLKKNSLSLAFIFF